MFTQSKCGNPKCQSARPSGTLHHGWALTRKVRRMTRCRSIPEFALDDTRRQVDEYKHFLDFVSRFTEINEMLCDQRLKLRRNEKNATAPPQDFVAALAVATLNKISSSLCSQDFSKAVDFEILQLLGRGLIDCVERVRVGRIQQCLELLPAKRFDERMIEAFERCKHRFNFLQKHSRKIPTRNVEIAADLSIEPRRGSCFAASYFECGIAD